VRGSEGVSFRKGAAPAGRSSADANRNGGWATSAIRSLAFESCLPIKGGDRRGGLTSGRAARRSGSSAPRARRRRPPAVLHGDAEKRQIDAFARGGERGGSEPTMMRE
jgi:hypothetical protein